MFGHFTTLCMKRLRVLIANFTNHMMHHLIGCSTIKNQEKYYQLPDLVGKYLLIQSHYCFVKSLDNDDGDEDESLLWYIRPRKVYQAWNSTKPNARGSQYRRQHRDPGLNLHRTLVLTLLNKVVQQW